MTLKRTYNLKIDTARAEYHSEDVKAEIAGILHGKKNYVEDSRTEQAFDTNCGLLDEVAKYSKLLDEEMTRQRHVSSESEHSVEEKQLKYMHM